MKKIYLLIIALMSAFAMNAADINVQDSDINSGDVVNWTKDNVYFLTERVYVDSGAVLNIEAGTVVKGNFGTGTNATVLVVARGGQIFARGTKTEPIIFTAAADDMSNPFDIAPGTKGRWGGVIILGNASLNSNPGFTSIEGLPTVDRRSQYGAVPETGATNDADNSGVFTYCSIRYGGISIASNNEINGLTLGGVGSGTEIHHVEVIFNFDDGVEFFGGTVNTHHMLVAFCGDDSYDYDEGYRGKGQFWVTVQADTVGDRMGEHDGGTDPETATPLATPEIYNATFIGRGTGNNRVMTLRDNAGGIYRNSIFVDQGRGIDIELLGNNDNHSYKRYQEGDLKIENNIFWNVAGNVAADIFKITADKYRCTTAANPTQCEQDSIAALNAATGAIQAYFGTAGNVSSDPLFASLNSNSRFHTRRELDPRPSYNGAAFTSPLAAYTDPFFKVVNYKGAFSSGGEEDFWVRDWTFMDQLGYFPAVVTSNDADLSAQFAVTPNPASDLINVTAQGVQASVATINVLDLQGRTVLSQEAQVSGDKLDAELNINTLTAGIYMVQTIVDGQAVSTTKVVKQ